MWTNLLDWTVRRLGDNYVVRMCIGAAVVVHAVLRGPEHNLDLETEHRAVFFTCCECIFVVAGRCESAYTIQLPTESAEGSKSADTSANPSSP